MLASLLHDLPTRAVVVALVQAQVLGRFLRGLRPLGHHGVARVTCKSLSSRTVLVPATTITPFLPRSVRLGPTRSPITGLAQLWTVGGLPLPVHHPAQSSSHSSTSAAQIRSKTPQLHPPLEDPVHARVVGKLFGQAVSLAAGAKPEDDGVQDASSLRPSTAGPLGRVSCSLRIGSILSHSSSGTRQIVGSGFSTGGRPVTGASPSLGSPRIVTDRRVLK